MTLSGGGPNDFRPSGQMPHDSDPNVNAAREGERRRSIAYRGRIESVLFVIGAGMAIVVAVAVLIGIGRAVL